MKLVLLFERKGLINEHPTRLGELLKHDKFAFLAEQALNETYVSV